MQYQQKQEKTQAVRRGWIKFVLAGLVVLGSITAVTLPHFVANIMPSNACSLVHSSIAASQTQQTEWINLKTESRFVISYHLVEKRDMTVSVLIKQKLDDTRYLPEIIESLKYTDRVYGSSGTDDYPAIYRDYQYSIYAEEIDCRAGKHTVKSETRYNRYDNIIVTNTYNLAYDINDAEPTAKLYRKYCS